MTAGGVQQRGQKHQTFDKVQPILKSKRKKINEDFYRNTLYYNEQKDHYTCPMGQPMDKIGERRRKTKNGYPQTSSHYQARNCNGCPVCGTYFKAQGNRIVERNLERHKTKNRQNLLSEMGQIKRKQRTAEVESVFVNIKPNRNFKRFTLHGIAKCELEFGLHAPAYNLRKKSA